jgi:hypothetical protein
LRRTICPRRWPKWGWLRISLPLIAKTKEIHQAVRRIKIGSGGEPAAPRVVLINLSFADATRPFFARITRPNASA